MKLTKADRLTHVEEIELIRAYQSDKNPKKSKRALDRLVMSNLGLIHKLVAKFPLKNATVTHDDLFQEGVAGLIKAISKFDVKRGYRLSTYAYNWINAYVRRYYQNHSRNVRVPIHVSDAQFEINKLIEKLTTELGRTPSMSEVRECYPKVDKVLAAMTTQVSLNSLLNENGELGDLQGVDTTDTMMDELDAQSLLTHLRNNVSERDYGILCAKFGVSGFAERSLSEIASSHDITRQRCNQIQHKCITMLKELVV